MTESPTLVVGAGGAAAGLVVSRLVARGSRVRALVHRPDQIERVRREGAGEVIVGDLADASAVEQALRGVRRAFYLAPAFIDDEALIGERFVEAARRGGVERIVFSSVIHPSLDLVNHAAKRPVEQALYDSGLEYTVLQPALFFQNFAAGWAATVASGVYAEPWAASSRFSRVDYREVAEVAAIALTSDDLVGGTFELAAEGQLDRMDVVGLMSEAAGTTIRAGTVPATAVAGAPPGLRAMFAHYDHAGILSSPITLRAILGREPRTLLEYFRELARTRQEEPR